MERISEGCLQGNTSWISLSFDADDRGSTGTKSQRKRKGKREDNNSKKFRGQTNKTWETMLKQDHVAWIEKYSPKTKEHLAVNKKKILQLEEWIKEALSACLQRRELILLITGPSGCGKSATVKVLASELKLELKEWCNVSHPHCHDHREYEPYSDYSTASQAALFSRFLLQENKYSSVFTKSKCQKLILVEEYPNTYLKDASMFHLLLRKYQKLGKCPLIFILSDNSKGQSFEQLLFPKHIKEELSLSVIVFNSISSTMMVKVLQQVVQDCNLLLGESKTRKAILENIAALSAGDIRNAINCLQFMYNPKILGNFHRNQSKKSSVAEASDTLSAAGRDTSLFLFHSLGKILYSKRETELCKEVFPQEKRHLNRPQLKENPEEVFHRTYISSTAFSLFLHQNYLDFMDKIETVSDCCTYFGDSDIICSDWTEQSVLQDYSASVVSRSLMFHLYSKNINNRWRPLHKPQWYSKQKMYNTNFVAFKEISQRWRLSSKELATLHLPYLIKISPLKLTANEKQFIVLYEVFTSKYRTNTKTNSLEEKEVVEDYSVENSALVGSTSCEILAYNNENEDLIEEYDE